MTIFDNKEKTKMLEEAEKKTSTDAECKNIKEPVINELKNEILDAVVNSSAIFKSQQKDEPELALEEKRKIAKDLLEKSHVLFLSKFGKYLSPKLLNFFTDSSENYEISHYIKKLTRYFNGTQRQIDRKNRRYEALKMLIQKGEYFSETEMMRRNPLLYDNLIGKYLTEEQRKARDNLDTTNITFVNLLMEKIDRDGIKDFKKNQEDAEDEVREENDSDSDSDEEETKQRNIINDSKNDDKWGEMCGNGSRYESEEKEKKKIIIIDDISYEEQQVLRQEFISFMYQSFLDGKDTDFDYSTVDDNETYDNIELREQDEEEKYFDSESPDLASPSDIPEKQKSDEESEDELDKYMRSLKVIS